MLGIAYTGSGPLTQVMVLNKWKMKYFLKYNNVPTLPFNTYFQEKIRNHDGTYQGLLEKIIKLALERKKSGEW